MVKMVHAVVECEVTMVTDSISIPEQVTKLCEKILKQHAPRNPLKQSNSNINLKSLKTLSYEILLKKSCSSVCIQDERDEWDARTKIVAYSYKLHQLGFTEQALEIHEKLDKLHSLGSAIESVLLFLVNLAGEVPPEKLDNRSLAQPIIKKMVNVRRLQIPLQIRVKPYTEYHPETFELPIKLDIENNNLEYLFDQEPGQGLELLGKFGNSAPATRKPRPLEEFFDFPDLTKPRDLTIPKRVSSHDLLDEGYATPSREHSMTMSCVNTRDDPLDSASEIWDLITTLDFKKTLTWESLGTLGPPKEEPFLTDSGPDSVPMVWKREMGVSYIRRNPLLNECRLLTNIDRMQLVRDLKYLLMGVPSEIFPYNQGSDGFVMRNGICVAGVTPGTLQAYCEDFLVCGTCCLRLRKLVERNMTTGNHQQEGLMFQALCASIRQYLQFYRSAVMMLPDGIVLSDLRHKADRLYVQMSCLGHLYKVHPNMIEEENTTLPEGVALLAYVYEEITKVTRRDVAYILYSALKACCQVYFNFLQKWIFEGVCQDAYTEFFIQEQPELMICRKREYWSRGFYMLEEAVPGFLHGIESSIFQCGKALNLLKLCNPQDPLCIVLQSGYPAIHCCLHSTDLTKLEADCLSYERTALTACGEIFEMRKYLQSIEEKEHAFQAAVQVAQKETLNRLKLAREMQALEVQAQKRARLAVLKEEMELAEARKIQQKMLVLEEDKEIARKAAELEEEESIRIELEKAEMVEYYSALTDIADKRRQHAEWRLKRMKLKEKRLEMLQEGAQATEINENPNNNNEEVEDVNSNISDMNQLNTLSEGDAISSTVNATEGDTISTTVNATEGDKIGTTVNETKGDTRIGIVKETMGETRISIVNGTKGDTRSSTINEIFVDTHSTPTMLSNGPNISNTVCNVNSDLVSSSNSDSFKTYKFTKHTVAITNGYKMTHSSSDSIMKPKAVTPCSSDSILKSKALSPSMITKINMDARMEAERNRRKVMSMEYNVVTGRYMDTLQMIMEPKHMEEVCSTDSNTSFETASERTAESNQTMNSESYAITTPVLNFKYTMQTSLGDSPLVNIADKVVTPIRHSKLAVAEHVGDSVTSSVNIDLQKSVFIPLRIQTRLVNSAVLKFFFQDKQLLSHLQSLRNYFFLLDGEFGRNVTGILFERMYKVRRPVDLLNCVTLNSILSKAVTCQDPNVERLSFNVKYIPPHFSLSSPLVLDCISLQYKVMWPLNIILTEVALRKYDDVFAFLLRLRRISWILEDDFHRLKRGAIHEIGLTCSPQYHKLQLYRHEMTHFVRALQNYITETVLHASWVVFLKNLQNACSFDDLYRTHVDYVKMVLFRCLLNKHSSPIQKPLMDLFRVILKFHGLLHSHKWQQIPGSSQYIHPRFSTLVQIYETFHECAVYIFKFATKLASTGYQPHLLELLQMLNMNGFYPQHF